VAEPKDAGIGADDIVVDLGAAPGAEEHKVEAPKRKKKHPKHQHEDLERWLLTYCDLITLLMAIFVIMYASSRIKEGQKGISVEMERIKNIQAREKRFLPVIPDAEERKIERLRIQIENLKKQKKIGPYINLRNSPRGLIISVPGGLFFESGDARIRDAALQALDHIMPSIKNLPNNIRVEGHTDNVPINTEAYPSNWHLSTARAISVVDFMVRRHGFRQERLSALGYADLKPVDPSKDNNSSVNRTKNRRVDIVVIKEHRVEAR
jgi:chemotaxis protein MotB